MSGQVSKKDTLMSIW